MRRHNTIRYVLNITMLSAFALLAACGGGGHGSESDPNVDSDAIIDPNAILGFDTPAGWAVNGGAWSATRIRTQGDLALEVSSQNHLTMTSAPVASTATALADLSSPGAAFLVDVFLPTEIGASGNPGTLELYVSAPSHGITNVSLGQVGLEGLRLGTYHTVKFEVPDAVQQQLAAAPFADLSFQFVLITPLGANGAYRFDNLRARTFGAPEPGPGESVDLVAQLLTSGENLPGLASFTAGVVQVPRSFRLKRGNAGAGTTELVLGYDGKAFVTCTYGASADGTSYELTSCTDGFQAGDLIGADYATLTILSADPTKDAKIRAQLALNPVGDLAGTEIIPPMPTYWGECAAPLPGTTPSVETISQWAVDTVTGLPVLDPVTNLPVEMKIDVVEQCDPSSISQIVTDYFDQVDPPMGVTVTAPVGDFARRFGDGSPHDNLAGEPWPENDPPFDHEGHLNKGGAWDGYWRLSGGLKYFSTVGSSGGDTTGQFDATLATGAVIWGRDVKIASAEVVTYATTGPMTEPGSTKQKTHAHVTLMVFGNTLYNPRFDVDGSLTASAELFRINPAYNLAFDLPRIQIWIFAITFGVNAKLGLVANAEYFAVGVRTNVEPSAAVGVRVAGGIDVGIASGMVNATVNLIEVSTPIGAEVSLAVDSKACKVYPRFFIDSKLKLSSGGGAVDLVAKFGVCPFCKSKSWSLLRWDGLSNKWPLFHYDAGREAAVDVGWANCRVPLNVQIPTTATAERGISYTLNGTAYRPATAGNSGGYETDCSRFTWSSSGQAVGDVFLNKVHGINPLGGAPGCSEVVKFATTGTRNVTLKVANAYGDVGEKTVTINVVEPPPGPKITFLQPATSSVMVGCASTVTLEGGYEGGTAPVQVKWYAENPLTGERVDLCTYDPASCTMSGSTGSRITLMTLVPHTTLSCEAPWDVYVEASDPIVSGVRGKRTIVVGPYIR